MAKNLPAKAGDMGSVLGWEDLLEEGMATQCSILAWRIPWTEEPGGLHGVVELDTTDRLILSRNTFFALLSRARVPDSC